MKSPAHLLLIDGSNVLRTCYEANPAPNLSEKVDGAIRSTLGSLRKALVRHDPTHVFVGFDVPNAKTWRHELFDEYKLGRTPTPEVLASRIPEIMQRVQEMGLFCRQAPGFEGEDLIAKVFRAWLSRCSHPATIASTDKDLALLVCEGAVVHAHFREEWRGEDWVRGTYGVEPQDLLTYFSLVGDSIDNVPGVKGVGPVTAVQLVNAHHTLEAIFEAAKSGALGNKNAVKKLLADEQAAYLSRELLSFRSMDLDLTFNMLKLAA